MQAYFKGQPILGERGPSGIDGNPVGTIISFMGTKAPNDYLVCDGAEYDIVKYPDLAQFFQIQFGESNHFGGDGAKTFAVPDLRNLFLRGYHGEGTEQLSGEIGEFQEGTQHPHIAGASDNNIMLVKQRNVESQPKNWDTSPIREVGWYSYATCQGRLWDSTAPDSIGPYYTARPDNAAVLYCVKAVGLTENKIPQADSTRIGTVISYLGTQPPADYLVCDGSAYDISEYPFLAQFFKEQFGTVNHFGGDGVATFAVPDFRNLFLRGYHGDSDEELSGEIGERQEATEQSAIMPTADSLYAVVHPEQEIINADTVRYEGGPAVYGGSKSTVSSYPYSFTARPVNAAVLYCIRAVDISPIPTEYDTDDGWHVRLFSDGFVEMSFWLGGIIPTSWERFGDTLYKYNVNDYHGFEFPVKLTELYSEVASVSSPLTDRAPGWCYTVFPEERLTTSLVTSIVVVASITTGPYELNITVTGRWK